MLQRSLLSLSLKSTVWQQRWSVLNEEVNNGNDSVLDERTGGAVCATRTASIYVVVSTLLFHALLFVPFVRCKQSNTISMCMNNNTAEKNEIKLLRHERTSRREQLLSNDAVLSRRMCVCIAMLTSYEHMVAHGIACASQQSRENKWKRYKNQKDHDQQRVACCSRESEQGKSSILLPSFSFHNQKINAVTEVSIKQPYV